MVYHVMYIHAIAYNLDISYTVILFVPFTFSGVGIRRY